MTTFLTGALCGALFAASVAAILMTRARLYRHEPIEQWSEEHYQPPAVTTRILIQERDIRI